MSMIDADERAAEQRSFFLKLDPQGGGEWLAQNVFGFLPPGHDSMEAELRDNVALWLSMFQSGATHHVTDTAWWMTRYMDRHGRMSKAEVTQRSEELQAFAIATIGILMDKKILSFVKEPEIPKLITSTADPINDDITQAILDRMEAGLKKDDEKHS